MRYAAKTDANQQEIIDDLRKAGACVYPTHRIGGGFPDLVVGIRGANYLLEVKTADGTLTPAERKFFDGWIGQAAIVRTSEEALIACGLAPYAVKAKG